MKALAAFLLLLPALAWAAPQPTPGDFVPQTREQLEASLFVTCRIEVEVSIPLVGTRWLPTHTVRQGQRVRLALYMANVSGGPLSILFGYLDREDFLVVPAGEEQQVWAQHFRVRNKLSPNYQHFDWDFVSNVGRWDGYLTYWEVTDNDGNPLPLGAYTLRCVANTVPWTLREWAFEVVQ